MSRISPYSQLAWWLLAKRAKSDMFERYIHALFFSKRKCKVKRITANFSHFFCCCWILFMCVLLLFNTIMFICLSWNCSNIQKKKNFIVFYYHGVKWQNNALKKIQHEHLHHHRSWTPTTMTTTNRIACLTHEIKIQMHIHTQTNGNSYIVYIWEVGKA